VEGCLELMGQLRLNQDTKRPIVEQVRAAGTLRTGTAKDRAHAQEVILRAMRMIGSTREYQFA